MVAEEIELLGSIAGVRPPDAELRSQPGECRADQPRVDEITPPAQSALTERLFARAAVVEQPLESACDPGVEKATDDLDDRAYRAAAAPEFSRHAGGRRPVAELGADDRHVLERLAARMIGHPLAAADLVAASTTRRPAPSALKPGLARQSAHIILLAIDHSDVDGERRRQYTDRSACAASRPLHRSRPHVSVAGLSYVFVSKPRSLARNAYFVRSAWNRQHEIRQQRVRGYTWLVVDWKRPMRRECWRISVGASTSCWRPDRGPSARFRHGLLQGTSTGVLRAPGATVRGSREKAASILRAWPQRAIVGEEMETILVASDDRAPEILAVLGDVTQGLPDGRLVEVIGNVTSDRIGLQLREAGFEVEYRDLDTLGARIQERCRVGSDFSAIVLSTLRPYRGMNEKLRFIAEEIRSLGDSCCLTSGVRVKNIPIVIALSLEMAEMIDAPTDGRFDTSIPWCSVRRPGASFSKEVNDVIAEWRRDVYLELDYVGYALGYNERGEIDISPVLRRSRRSSHLFSDAASPRSLGEGGMVLVPQNVTEHMGSLLELREICGNLENIASRLDKKPETVVHEFLDRHPDILYRDHFVEHWSEKSLAPKTRPDFVLRSTVDWEVLELKRPDEIVIRKKRFSRAVVKGFQQLRRYQDSLQSPASQARQEAVFGESIVAPRLCLLIGRSLDPEFSAEVRQTHEVSEFNDVSLLLYDELANPLWRRVHSMQERLLGQFDGL